MIMHWPSATAMTEPLEMMLSEPLVLEERAEVRFIDMPVSLLRVSAGTGAFLDEDSFETVSFPETQIPHGAEFGVRVSGDSMEPAFRNGDLVLVAHTREIREGEIGIFLVDNEGYIKEYRKDGLHSHNPEYRTMTFREDQAVRCVGRVIGKLKEEQIPDSETLNRIAEAERAGKEPQ